MSRPDRRYYVEWASLDGKQTGGETVEVPAALLSAVEAEVKVLKALLARGLNARCTRSKFLGDVDPDRELEEHLNLDAQPTEPTS